MYLNFITNQLNSSQTTVISIQCPVESILSYFIKKLTEAASAQIDAKSVWGGRFFA